ncbi:MAG: type II toxin-antitoxin system HicB family antitoxin [Gammaproteobacteria bacterium]|nr:type II toxin-antitoxin system HicB family antitoxin [Gammaproteobacteria bacterium]
MRYVSFIHRDPDSGYGISFPDFPGCVSAGDTVDETVQHGCEALAFHVEGLSADGEPIPAPRSVEAIRADPVLADWQRGADIVLVPLLSAGVSRGGSTLPSATVSSKP